MLAERLIAVRELELFNSRMASPEVRALNRALLALRALALCRSATTGQDGSRPRPHDWEDLAIIADKVLDHGRQCRLMQQLKSTTREKFESALSQAEQLRKRYFGVSRKKKPSRTRSAAPAEPVVRAAMKLVA